MRMVRLERSLCSAQSKLCNGQQTTFGIATEILAGAAKGIGFEVEPAVFDLTRRNIAHLDAPIELALGSYKELVGTRKDPADHRVVVESGGCSY